jgi:hypothetical protein
LKIDIRMPAFAGNPGSCSAITRFNDRRQSSTSGFPRLPRSRRTLHPVNITLTEEESKRQSDPLMTKTVPRAGDI